MKDEDSHDPVVVITGGTGSFGSAFARLLLRETRARVRLISRGEHAQRALAKEIGCERTTFIIADVRNLDRLCVAFDGADLVVHAAALKLVPGSEIHGWEYTLTNIVGTMNVIEAAVKTGVPRSLFISTDKAVDPFNPDGKMKAVLRGYLKLFDNPSNKFSVACSRSSACASRVSRIFQNPWIASRSTRVWGSPQPTALLLPATSRAGASCS